MQAEEDRQEELFRQGRLALEAEVMKDRKDWIVGKGLKREEDQ